MAVAMVPIFSVTEATCGRIYISNWFRLSELNNAYVFRLEDAEMVTFNGETLINN